MNGNRKDGSGIPDDSVIRSVKEGRTQNFEIIVNRYRNRIINFIFRMTGDHDEARSIAQDVFLMIFTKIDNYRENGTFQSYIFTIARNITLNYIKKTERFTMFSHLGDGKAEEIAVSGQDIPSVKEEKKEDDELLNRALLDLNVDQRLALILKIYLGFSYKKIMEITGWSQPKTETLISRGRMNVIKRVRLQEKGGKNV